MELRDADLIARVLASDDHHAFGELVRRHQSSVRGFLRRLTGGRDGVSDDLAQETFLEAHRALPRFHGTAAFPTWLLGIAYNRYRQHQRRIRRTESLDDATISRPAAADGEATAPAHTNRIDMRTDLDAALDCLPADERHAIHLCFDAGLSHEEAAAVLGCPLGTLKSHIARAKEKLRARLRVWASS